MPTPPRTPAELDPALIAGLRARDPAALAALYRAGARFVYGLALRIVRDAPTAEEVTQDVFLYVWQQVDRYDATRGTLASWLVTLARSRAIDRLRARDSQARRVDGLVRAHAAQAPEAPPSTLAELLDAERGAQVRSALQLLPAEQRQALEIAYFEGLSHREIAARLEAPLGTVKTRIRQGMLRLRAALESERVLPEHEGPG